VPGPALEKAPAQEKAPAGDWPGLDFDGDCYILGLQALPLASHIPPALVQSAFVFAVVTSAANVGAVNANASPKATIIESSFDIGTTPPSDRTTFVVALKSYWFLGVIVLRPNGAVAKMLIPSGRTSGLGNVISNRCSKG